jgi:hypothetical protein
MSGSNKRSGVASAFTAIPPGATFDCRIGPESWIDRVAAPVSLWDEEGLSNILAQRTPGVRWFLSVAGTIGARTAVESIVLTLEIAYNRPFEAVFQCGTGASDTVPGAMRL